MPFLSPELLPADKTKNAKGRRKRLADRVDSAPRPGGRVCVKLRSSPELPQIPKQANVGAAKRRDLRPVTCPADPVKQPFASG